MVAGADLNAALGLACFRELALFLLTAVSLVADVVLGLACFRERAFFLLTAVSLVAAFLVATCLATACLVIAFLTAAVLLVAAPSWGHLVICVEA